MINDYLSYDKKSFFDWAIHDLIETARLTIDQLDSGSPSYYGMSGNTKQEARRYANQVLHGYMGTAEATPVVDVPSDTLDPISVDCCLDMYGAYPDIGTYLSGAPECMVNFTPPPNTRMITIAVSNCCSGEVTKSQLDKIGRALAGLIKGIEDKGYQVRLDCYMINYVGHGQQEHMGVSRLVVKDHQDVFDGDMIEWILSSQGFRWGMWALSDRFGSAGRHFTTWKGTSNLPCSVSRGYPGQPGDQRKLIEEVYGIKYDLILDGASHSSQVTKTIKAIESYRLPQ